MTRIETFLAPIDIEQLRAHEIADATCVVFDILRATSVFVTALGNGALSVCPVSEIAAALAVRAMDPLVLLAGERHGLRLTSSDTGSVEFDLGNSPREFTREAVAGRRIVSTTTNGTRALKACGGARHIYAASFLNMAATVQHCAAIAPTRLLLLCAGTGERMAAEDVLAAGAFCDAIRTRLDAMLEESSLVAVELFEANRGRLTAAMGESENGRKLLGKADLRDDVAFCSRVDVTETVVRMNAAGELVSA
jgi:2-phosphosulfolactate phosphatase